MRIELFLDPRYARFASTRYKVRAADGEHVVTIDQAAIAPDGGGFVAIGDFTLNGDSALIVEDNVAFAPPDDRKSIMLDAVRVSAIPPPAAADPETGDDDGGDDVVVGDPVDDGDDGAAGDDADDAGADAGDDAGEDGPLIGAATDDGIVVEVEAEGGCSQAGLAPVTLTWVLLTPGLIRWRRRRR